MAIEVLTKEDLTEFRHQLLNDFRKLMETKSTEKPQRWLKSHEVKQLLNISSGTLQNLRINGTLPYSKIGGTIFYDGEAIEKILSNNRINGKRTLFSTY